MPTLRRRKADTPPSSDGESDSDFVDNSPLSTPSSSRQNSESGSDGDEEFPANGHDLGKLYDKRRKYLFVEVSVCGALF